MQNSVSGYAGIQSIARKPDGGFYLVRVRSLLAAWIKFTRREIDLYQLRLWVAAHEAVARRCQLPENRLPTFTEEELIGLLGGGTRSKARNGIRRLVDAGLLDWDRNHISTDTCRAEAMLAETDEWLDSLLLVKNNLRRVPVPASDGSRARLCLSLAAHGHSGVFNLIVPRVWSPARIWVARKVEA